MPLSAQSRLGESVMHSPRGAVTSVPGSDRFVWCAGALTRVLADGNQTAGAYGMVEDYVLAGSGPPMHKHDDDEAFCELDGQLTYFVEGKAPIKAGPGWFIHVPGGTVHGFRADSETVRYLIITTPHHVDFYLAMSDPAERYELPPAAEPDWSRMGAACEQFGVKFTGDWPDA